MNIDSIKMLNLGLCNNCKYLFLDKLMKYCQCNKGIFMLYKRYDCIRFEEK